MKRLEVKGMKLSVITACVGQSRLGKGIVTGTCSGMWGVLEGGGNTVRYCFVHTARVGRRLAVRTYSHKNRQPSGAPGFNSLPADRLIYLVEFERGKLFNCIQGMKRIMEIQDNIDQKLCWLH